jgi:prophage antirepressor-like protein
MSRLEMAVVSLHEEYHFTVADLARVFWVKEDRMQRMLRQAKTRHARASERLMEVVFGDKA